MLNAIKSAVLPARMYFRSRAWDRKLADKQVELSDTHLEKLRVISCREKMLEELPKNAVVAEIGVAEGEFSREIVDRCQPKELVLIDVWESVNPQHGSKAMLKVKDRLAAEIADGTVKMRQGFSFDVLETFPDNYFDWVYVDAAHDYENVCRDISLCLQKVKDDGIIAGHDYIRWARGPARYGVIEAVNEAVIENEMDFLYLTHEQDQHLSWAIQSKAA
jgi:SAM-dependent methyltransferase